MMHGYLPFDRTGGLLVPFRTWRNTTTGEASEKLSSLFGFNIPQRWSIAHLYQAMLNKEPHVGSVSFLTTLSGYIHWKLRGEKVIGVGDGSGMFPIDSEALCYDKAMVQMFDSLAAALGTPVTIMETAGEGGPWGMAVLAAFQQQRASGQSLASCLSERVFGNAQSITISATEAQAAGFAAFMEEYKKCLAVERAAVQLL